MPSVPKGLIERFKDLRSPVYSSILSLDVDLSISGRNPNIQSSSYFSEVLITRPEKF
jgi:hypothetical protein